ncbi:MAG: alpha/beta fold hydrolase [Thermoanaerobaculia bacterium]
MVARRTEPERRRDRRRRLVKGLLGGLAVGGAAVGIPALINALVARRSKPLAPARWGRGYHYAWRGGDVAFQRLGAGPAAVLLHSFGPGASGEEWREVAETLAADHEIFVPDLLGWGRSDKPRRTYDGELYLRLLVDFLVDVVARPATLVAAGLPAGYAMLTAVDHPEIVDALALLTPLGLDLASEEPDLMDALAQRALRLPILGTTALNAYTSRAALTRWLRNEVFAAPERADAALVDMLHRAAHQPGGRYALTAWLCGYLNVDVEPALTRSRQRLWLGWGRAAVTPAVESADRWLRHRPDAELEVFEACGSLPHLEAPRRVAASLARFLTPR